MNTPYKKKWIKQIHTLLQMIHQAQPRNLLLAHLLIRAEHVTEEFTPHICVCVCVFADKLHLCTPIHAYGLVIDSNI